jgi:Arc/MetJ family transcription regulator
MKVYAYTHKGVHMRTNIVLDDEFIKEAMRLSHAKTKKALIHDALKEYVENRKRMNLQDLAGKISFAKDYDYKSMRTGK